MTMKTGVILILAYSHMSCLRFFKYETLKKAKVLSNQSTALESSQLEPEQTHH